MSYDSDLASDESDTRRSKRRRLERSPPRFDNEPLENGSLPKSQVPTAESYVIGTYATESFTDTQHLEIYYAWLRKLMILACPQTVALSAL
jgi:hypothetical protein